MRQINLLPQELKPNKRVGILVRKAEKYFIASILIYVLLLVSVFVAKNYLNNKLEELVDKKSELSGELKSLVAVETSSVYIRDRVAKYVLIKDRNIEKTNVDNFEKIMSFLPTDASVKSVEIKDRNIAFQISIKENYQLTKFLNDIVSLNIYKQINIQNLSYVEETGYSLDLQLTF